MKDRTGILAALSDSLCCVCVYWIVASTMIMAGRGWTLGLGWPLLWTGLCTAAFSRLLRRPRSFNLMMALAAAAGCAALALFIAVSGVRMTGLHVFTLAVGAGMASALPMYYLVRRPSLHGHLSCLDVLLLAFAWLLVFAQGLQAQLWQLSARTYLFLALSGLCTGASWLCYFHALKLGTVNQVTPVDKSSTVLTMLLAWLLLGEPITWLKAAAMAGIMAGTLLMIERRPETTPAAPRGHGWLLYAALSAVFAALTAILGKVGIENVPSDLGTALRTVVVLLMAWAMVFVTGRQAQVRAVGRRDLVFILLSGVATGMSWLCYYRALQEGPASVVVPLDKLSVVVTIVFSRVFLHERLSRRALAGFALLVAGTGLLLL